MIEGSGFRNRWMRAGRAIERILGGPWDAGESNADYQLYHAVISGEVRARIDGVLFTDFKYLKSRKWSNDNIWALPADLELNLDDIDRIWNWDTYDTADLIATNRIDSLTAQHQAEVALLNLDTLLKRVFARLPAISLEQALKETNFEENWEKFDREYKLLCSIIEHDTVSDLDLKSTYSEVLCKRDRLFNITIQNKPKSKRGAKPKYNWASVQSHIKEKFEYNGFLSSDDPEWSCQADVERAISDFISKEYGRIPAISTVRKKAKEYIEIFMADN